MTDRTCVSMLARVIAPYAKGNAEELARTVINKYGSLSNVFCKSIDELEELVGASVAVHIKLLAYVTSRRGTERLRLGEICSEEEIAAYFKSLYICESIEKIYVMLFDREGRVLAVTKVGEGTVSASEILPRKMLEAAVAHEAHSVLIVHNHPSGECHPSRGDLKFAAAMSTLLESVSIGVRGYMIVSGQCANIVDFNLI